ncbi:PTS galactitol transporter subunit IIC [Pseudalkalibacillus caeni]|uniref:PTS galactitol transporter subunit IIC n=1 Tax=Exobacillus caeni TaxID=2574798 RepID=A0A5R9F5B2_9BACL|nr:PTS transporter subunit IIC [Pseudalkalibacillus caeni]TLS38717.1 PTS galactitol transporter subunit IIC [Pseudalkalibacillus caeni]
MDILEYIVGLGPSVMLPIIIFLFGLLVKAKPSTAFRSGLIVGIGFVGINLVIGLLVNSLGPAAKDMVSRLGVELSIIDVGWPATSAISFGSTVGALAIPIGLGVNVAMLFFGLTKTLNVDLWNLWHIAFTGALVSILTGSITMGIVTALVHTIIILVLADLTAKHVQEYYGYPNVSFPHGTSTPYYLIALPMNKVFDSIPGIKNIKADPDTIQKRLGVFGEPMVLGLILGAFIGVLAGWNVQETLTLGVQMATVMLLLPRVTSILMEGLMPISEAAGDLVKKRLPERDLYIGMDSALAVGHPAVIASTLLLIPIVLGIAAFLPGNKVLPFADLVTIPFIICLMVPVFRGNVFRTVVTGAVAIGIGLWIATYISPFFTSAAKNAGFQFPEGASQISSLVDGAVPTTAIMIFASKLGYVGLVGIGIIFLAIASYQKKKAARAEKESSEEFTA